MPLIQSSLSSSLESLFSDPPPSASACARQWADAMRDYSLSVFPASTTAVAAAEVLSATLSPIFETSVSAASTAAAMEAAWAVFAITLGTGMAPGYVAVPPIGLVGFIGLFSLTPSSHSEAASNVATAIHIWMSTGTATPVPTGPSINWS